MEAPEEAVAEPGVGWAVGRSVLHLFAAREVKSGDGNRGTGGSGARGAQLGGGSQPGCPGAG